MAGRVPIRALSFTAKAASLAARHGVRRGLQQAAAKANPALLAIEAAVSVADAVNAYLDLRASREHREALLRIIPHEATRLALEREQIRTAIDLARAELDQQAVVQERIGALALSCAAACGTIWAELLTLRSAALPDIAEFERRCEALEDAWSRMQRAVSLLDGVVP